MDIPQITVKNVQKVFRSDGQEVIALKDIDLEVRAGEFVCLLGPSGCGKSTLLNAIAGFSLPTSGSVTVDGNPVLRPGPDRGMVFQEYALYPWMTVAENVAFGLKIKGIAKTEIAERVKALLEKLSLHDFRKRFPKDLSGGMRQRVAIARVLAIDSPIMLMDEPFGALDSLTRRNLQDELLRIWADLKKTIIFVTHSIEEAIYLADRVVVMTHRPGTIKLYETIRLPRPRDSESNMFNEIKRSIGQIVREEQTRHEEDERRLTKVS